MCCASPRRSRRPRSPEPNLRVGRGPASAAIAGAGFLLAAAREFAANRTPAAATCTREPRHARQLHDVDHPATPAGYPKRHRELDPGSTVAAAWQEGGCRINSGRTNWRRQVDSASAEADRSFPTFIQQWDDAFASATLRSRRNLEQQRQRRPQHQDDADQADAPGEAAHAPARRARRAADRRRGRRARARRRARSGVGRGRPTPTISTAAIKIGKVSKKLACARASRPTIGLRRRQFLVARAHIPLACHIGGS